MEKRELFYKVQFTFFKLTPVGYQEIQRTRKYKAPGIEAAIRLAKMDPEYMSDSDARIVSAEEL